MPIRFGIPLPGPLYWAPRRRRHKAVEFDTNMPTVVVLWTFAVTLFVVPVLMFGGLGVIAWPSAFALAGQAIQVHGRVRALRSWVDDPDDVPSEPAPDGWRTYDRSLLDDVT